jgi:PAS domain S-box-containing protein
MLYRFVYLLLFVFLFSTFSGAQTNFPDNSFFINLSESKKNALLEEWIKESNKQKKWSHQARLNFALAAYENAGDYHPLKMRAMYCLAELYFNEGRFRDAFAFFDTLSTYAAQHNDIGLDVSVKNFEGNIYRYKGDYYGALDKIYDAYKLATNHKIDSLLPMTLNNLGVVYRNLSDNSQANKYYEKALQSAILHKDTHQIIQAYTNMGNLAWFEKQLEKAQEHYTIGLNLAQKSNDVQHMASLNNNLGNIYRDNFQIEEALDHYFRALDFLNEVTLVGLKAIILHNIGIAYQITGNYGKALEHINSSLEITQTVELNRFSRDNYFSLAQIYFEQGRIDEAYSSLSNYVEINQQLFNDQLVNSITYFNEKIFDAERKEQELMFRNERNILLLILVVMAFAFMLSMLIVLLKNHKQKRIHIEKLKATLKEKDATEAALRQSENNYHTFIRTLNEGMVVLDSTNKIEFLNFKACNILGSDSIDDLIGFAFERFLLSPEDEKVFRDKMELQKIGIADQYELQLRNLNGDVLWISISSAPILDINQNAKGSVNLISNVTERKQTEQTYNELTTNLNQKIKQLNCMYDISDISGVPGITFEEIIEKSLEIIPVGLKYSHDIAVQIMFDNKVYSSKNYKETPWSYMVPIKVQKKKLGYLKVLYLEEKPTINKDAFHFNEKILLKNISEKFGQILEAKNMERILRDNQEKLQEVQKLAKIGNWERDFTTNQIIYSDIFYDILEITPEKKRFFDQDKFIELIHPDDKSLVENLDLDLIGSNPKPVVNVNYRIITGKGMIKHIYSTRKIVTDESGKAIRCVYTMQEM